MKLNWLNNGFICKELYAPYIIDNDNEYYNSLREKFNIVLRQAENAEADSESIDIIQKFRNKILESLRSYYDADLSKSNTIVKNLIKNIGDDPLAVNTLLNSSAFPGCKDEELQFFRCRIGDPSKSFTAKEMLHLPKKMRARSGNYRFSIPGNPSLYLANSSYGCWVETGFPSAIDFNVSPVLLDGTQKVFNLAVSIRDFHCLKEWEKSRVHCWLKLLMLTIATSFRIKEEGRTFKSEYIISQAIMMACKKLGYDGVAYFSKRVSDEMFSRCAINLALFVTYEDEYSELVKHMKMDNSFNYALYNQLLPSLKYKDYNLRSVRTGFITNIGSYDRQFPYRETEFFNFDKFLFTTWESKPNNKEKDKIPWGVIID
ncbi:MAG: RES family NAD+ phosphorylase [Bacteroides sp.]|nr:RES family NAD+ phosphorylase [Bacteroides sp.]